MQRHSGTKELNAVALRGNDYVARAMWWERGTRGGREAGNEAESGRGEAGAVPLTNTGRSRKMKTEPGTPPSVASQCPPDQMNPVNPDKEQCQVNPDKEHGQTDTRGRIINLRQLL